MQHQPLCTSVTGCQPDCHIQAVHERPRQADEAFDRHPESCGVHHKSKPLGASRQIVLIRRKGERRGNCA